MAAKLMKKAGFESIELFKDQIIGIGAFGAVCHAQCDDLPCAAKILDSTIFSMARQHKMALQFEQECKFIRTIQHPNIVQYLGVHYDDITGQPVLLMEMMDENLTHFLESSPDKVPYHLQVNFCRDTVLALSYLHSNGIIHRNLSSNNVLLICKARAKVSDFGMAKLSSFDPKRSFLAHTMSSTTLPYMPPEGLRNNPNYDVKIDCFSFGVVTIQIMTRKFPSPTDCLQPLDTKSAAGLLSYTIVPEVERRKDDISKIDPNHPLLQITLPCLSNDSTQRPSAQKLYKKIKKLQESDKYHKSVSDSGKSGVSRKGASSEKSSNELKGNQPMSGEDADAGAPNQEQTISNTMKASNSHIPEEYHDGPIDGAEDPEAHDVIVIAAEVYAKEDELESKHDNVSISQQESKQDGTEEPEQESRDDIQKSKPKSKQDGTEESELESKCDDVSVTQQSKQESKREESEIESKQDGTDESEVESKHDNAEPQGQESKRDDAQPDRESKQKAKEGEEVQTHSCTEMANDSPEITILSADSATKPESSPEGDSEASDSYVAEEKVEEYHDRPIDGAEDPETQDVIIIAAEIHTCTKEDETLPEQNSPNKKTNLSDQHPSNYQDYEQKSLKVSRFDKEEEILGESLPKSQGIKSADSSRSTDKGELIVIPSPSSVDKNGDQSCKSMHEIEEHIIEDEEISKPVEDENTESHRDSPQHENGAEAELRSKEEREHIIQIAVTTSVKREENEDTAQDSGHEDVQQEMQGSENDDMNKKEEYKKPTQIVENNLQRSKYDDASATEQRKEEHKHKEGTEQPGLESRDDVTQKPKRESKQLQDGTDESEIENKHDNAEPKRQENKQDDAQPDQESKQKAKEGKEVQTHSGTEKVNNSPEITILSQATGSDGKATKPEGGSEDKIGNVYNLSCTYSLSCTYK